jgi:hypothetical protein
MSFGFIILRHVNNDISKTYWEIAYKSIRKYYPHNKIIIIDDNSNYEYIDTTFEKTLYKTTIIKSEWTGRGELLPYIYYINHGWVDTAVILHDSVFVNKYIDFEAALTNGRGYRFLWEFGIKQDSRYLVLSKDEIRIMKSFINTDNTDNLVQDLLHYHSRKELWVGCFGAMSVINYEYLITINNLFPLSNLLAVITNRDYRKSFERVFACLCQYVNAGMDNSLHNISYDGPIGTRFNKPLHGYIGQLNYHCNLPKSPGVELRRQIELCRQIHNSMHNGTKESLLGNIFYYCYWGKTLHETNKLMNTDKRYIHLPLIKIWSGR